MTDGTWSTDNRGGGGSVPSRPVTRRRRRSPFGPTLVILGLLALLVMVGSQVATSLLWYDSVAARRVLLTEWGTRSVLFAAGFLLAALVLGLSVWAAHRMRPLIIPETPAQQVMAEYRSRIEPVRRRLMVGGVTALSLLVGLSCAAAWQTALLWWNRQPFGVSDAHFGFDIGFFVFTLPWVMFVLELLTVVLVAGLVGSAMTHYLYGGVQLGGQGLVVSRAARTQLALLAAALVAVRGVDYWFSRYERVSQMGSRITGISYTDANAVLPARAILAAACLVCAALFIATIWTRTWRLPMTALAGLVAVALVIGGAYPMLMQSLKVRPSEVTLEAQYYQRNMDATRAAYGLGGIEMQTYAASEDAPSAELQAAAKALPGVRLLDPALVSDTFRQLQGSKSYYSFPDTLDVDRYTLDGITHDTVVGVREMFIPGLAADQQNWINRHLVYTHGFGVVAAYGNRRQGDGEPVFFQRDIPPVGELGDFEPRVYFGERSSDYAIVGAKEGDAPRELDYPSETDAGGGQVRTSYAGSGGVALNSAWKRMAYAVKYGELKILLSSDVTASSRMLDHRTPLERVSRVAPWLRLDGNPYPAVVDGRVQWIVDGYTVSAHYPYSQQANLSDLTSDAIALRSQAVDTVAGGTVNYIRNSVKATVDAYDGRVTLYAWDEGDPLLTAWSAAFPGLVKPTSEIPGTLMSHLRYPEGLFKVQREMIGRYHVDNPGAFYSGDDFWQVPEDTSGDTEKRNEGKMPPYYLSVALPNEKQPTFSLTTPYVPFGAADRTNLVGYLAVDADAGSQAGTKREGYGKLRLLTVSRGATVKGPGQVHNDVTSSTTRSAEFDLPLVNWLGTATGSATKQFGNQLTLPFAGGFLYVQPIYVKASQEGSSFPKQMAVVVVYGDRLAWGTDLNRALEELFTAEPSVPETPGTGTPPTASPTDSPTTAPSPTSPVTSPTTPAPTGDLATALADAQKAYDDSQAALQRGDWTAYGEAQERLKAALDRAIALNPSGGSIDLGTATAPATTPTSAPTSAG